jgi:hypothetical protein
VHGQETNLVAGEPPEQLARGKQNPPSEFLSFTPLQASAADDFLQFLTQLRNALFSVENVSC